MNIRAGHTIKKDVIRRTNRSAVLQSIFTQGPVSRKDLTALTGLTNATITKFVDELISGRLIDEIGSDMKSKRLGGPIPVLLDLSQGPPYVFGVHIGVTKIGVGLVNLRSTPVEMDLHDIRAGMDGRLLLRKITNSILNIVKKRGLSLERDILGIGVAIAGVVDSDSGTLVWHDRAKFRNLAVKDILERELGPPVFVGNIVKAQALAESQHGKGKSFDNFLYLFVGGIVGCAFVNRREVYLGARNIAGEIGHMKFKKGSPRCHCGRSGCLEAIITEKAILNRAKSLETAKECTPTQNINRKAPDELSMDDLVRAADAENEIACKLLLARGKYLGKAIGDLVNILDPQIVIVGFGLLKPNPRKKNSSSSNPFGSLVDENEFLSEMERLSLIESLRKVLCRPEHPPLFGCWVPRDKQILASASLIIKHVFSPMLDIDKNSRADPVLLTLKSR